MRGSAAFLWMAVEQRASLVVASTIEDAGKTTMLTALLDFLPAEVETIYLRGWYERFDFLDSRDPRTTYLLCNEISNNLPTYLWGNGRAAACSSRPQRGFPLATTIARRHRQRDDRSAGVLPARSPTPSAGQYRLRRLTLERRQPFLQVPAPADAGRDDSNLDGDDVAVETIAERDVLLCSSGDAHRPH